MVVVLLFVVGVAGVAAFGFWSTGGSRRRTPPTEIRRSDDGEREQLPTTGETLERLADAMVQTRPPT